MGNYWGGGRRRHKFHAELKVVSFFYVCLAHFSFLWDLLGYAPSNSPNNHNKWYQSRKFGPTLW